MISIEGRSESICIINLGGRGNKSRNYRYSRQGNECRNCGQTWNLDHRNSCLAKGQLCRKGNGRSHYARVCRSQNNYLKQSRSVNKVQKSDTLKHRGKRNNCVQVHIETNLSYDGSSEDYQVNMVSDYSDSEPKETKEPKYFVTKFRKKTYNIMVDT